MPRPSPRRMRPSRATARAEKDWATADEVRDRLAAAGIEVTDTAEGPQWQVKE